MQVNELTSSSPTEQTDLQQPLCRAHFRHGQNEKRRPLICIRPELSAGDGLIQCDMIMNPPHQHYICLSYVWGSQAAQKTILIDGRLFHVRDNLWRFLNRARLTRITRPIWIDAICIDQTNILMRNHWVQQMGRIFQEATGVLVWLGDGDSGIETSLGYMDFISDYYHTAGKKNRTSLTRHTRDMFIKPGSSYRALQRLAYLPYWDRLWIKQEVLLNLNVCYLYGKAKSYRLCRLICSCDLSGQPCHAHLAFGVGRTPCAILLRLSNRKPAADMQNFPPLKDLIKSFAESASLDVRDKVYGLLGMTSGCNLTVDYSISPVALFVRTLVATGPFLDDTKNLVEYFSALVNALGLCEADLRRSNIECLLRKYEGNDWQSRLIPSQLRNDWFERSKWTIHLDLVPFALFEQLQPRNASSLEYWKQTAEARYASQMLVIADPFADDLADIRPAAMNLVAMEHHRLLIRDIRLQAGDVMLNVASGNSTSSIFLIARSCDSQQVKSLQTEYEVTEYEVTAVAEATRVWQSCVDLQQKEVNIDDIDLTIFDPPKAFEGVLISKMTALGSSRYLLRLDIHQMATICLALNTLRSMPRWSWKTEKMTGMATASIVKL